MTKPKVLHLSALTKILHSGVCLMLLTGASLAQESVEEEQIDTLDTVIISGEKLDRDIKNTASSVVVFSAPQIKQQKTGDQTLRELLGSVPNITYTDSFTPPIIRGQNSEGPHSGQNVFWGGTVPRATFSVDGSYLSHYEFDMGAGGLWDIQNIEVFRGPQTTSQGANAIAGAFIVNTKDPTFFNETLYQAEIGSYNMKRTSLAVSGPIYKQELAARLAVDYFGRDTFIDYINPNFVDNGISQNLRNLNLRGKILWQPVEMPQLEAKLTYSHNHMRKPTQEAASQPFDKLNHRSATMPGHKQRTDSGIFDLSYEFDNGLKFFNQMQYSTSYIVRRTGLGNGGEVDLKRDNISNESRLVFGSGEDTISGVVGIFYAQTTSDEKMMLQGLTAYDDKKDNLGLYTQIDYRLTDGWTLSGGLRYQRDNVDRSGTSTFVGRPLDYDESFSAVLPRLSLAYAITPDITIGGLVSQGYNPGGVSLNLTSRQWASYKKETLWNYELFMRTSLLDDRLKLNSNIFYMDFKDAQYNIPVVISPGVVQAYTINAEKAHSYGLELGMDYQILDNLSLRASAGLLRTEIEEISYNRVYEGNEFTRSPGYSLSAGFSWDVTEKFNIAADIRHIDGYYSDLENRSVYLVDAYTIADLRLAYDFDEKLELYGYVKNLFDERKPTYLRENRGIGGIEASMTMPRTFGVGIRGSF